MSHLSYEGQSETDYCIECAVKHSQTAKVLMREAVQRAEAGNPHVEGVKEKVRGVIEELSGMEDDTNTVQNENVSRLNNTTRNLRKYIYSTQAEIGGADLGTLKQIKMMIDKLVEETYEVREKEEECPECVVSAEVEKPKSLPASMSTTPKDLEKYGVRVAEKRRKFLEEIQAEVPE